MNRRQTIALLAAGGLAPLIARAETGVIPRLGYVWIGHRGTDSTNLPGLRKGLIEKGYVPGQTILIDDRYAEGQPDRIPRLFAEVLDAGAQILLTPGTPLSLAARHVTASVPIISFTGDPVAFGLAGSLARPGGNVTGFSTQSADFGAKWLGLLLELVPGMRRVGLMRVPDNPGTAPHLANALAAARERGIVIVPQSVRREDVDATLAGLSAARLDGLVVTDDPVNESLLPRILSAVAVARVPAISGFETATAQGGLRSYSINRFDLFRRAAGSVDRILKGASPADMPIEQASAFALGINLRTASEFGLQIPPALLAAADELVD